MPKPLLKPYADQKYSHIVYFDAPDGTRKRRKFTTRKAAEGFLTDKECDHENLGRTIAATVTEDLKRDAHGASKLLREFGVTLEDAAAHYRKHLLATSKSAPVAGLIDEMIAQKLANGRSKRHLDDLRSRLNRFADAFGTRFAAEVSTEEVEQWLLGVPEWSNATRNHYRSKLHSFFSWCVKKRKCTVNPITAVERADQPPTTCEIYHAHEMRTMLHAATKWTPKKIRPVGKRGRNRLEFDHQTDDVLANLVICGFAGLRQSEFERLTWEMVKLDRSKIDLPPEITKTKKRKLVTIQPVLAAWLAEYFPVRVGPIAKTNFHNRQAAFKRHLRDHLKLPWRHNGLRHSFASHLLEQTKNPGHVAMELGHRGEVGTLWDHYAERVDGDDTGAYWALTPEVVNGGDMVGFSAKAVSA